MKTPIIQSSQPSPRTITLPTYDTNKNIYVQFGKAKKAKTRPMLVINKLNGLQNTRDKLRQHELLQEAGIPKPRLLRTYDDAILFMRETGGTVVAKRLNHSRCRGMYRFETVESLETAEDMRVRDPSLYYFEEFVKVNREWRVHVSYLGEVVSYRKCLRAEALEGDRPWFRNLENCYFKYDGVEEDKRPHWPEVIDEVVRGLNVLGMDIAGCDIGENTKVDPPQWYVFEYNSACGMEEGTREHYEQAIDQIIKDKL